MKNQTPVTQSNVKHKCLNYALIPVQARKTHVTKSKLKHNHMNDNQSKVHWRFAHHQTIKQCFEKLNEELKH